MLVWYKGECIVSIISIKMVAKNLHVGMKIVIPIKIDIWWVCQTR